MTDGSEKAQRPQPGDRVWLDGYPKREPWGWYRILCWGLYRGQEGAAIRSERCPSFYMWAPRTIISGA